jgi:hypothetical protein
VASFHGNADTLDELATVPTTIEKALDFRFERRDG